MHPCEWMKLMFVPSSLENLPSRRRSLLDIRSWTNSNETAWLNPRTNEYRKPNVFSAYRSRCCESSHTIPTFVTTANVPLSMMETFAFRLRARVPTNPLRSRISSAFFGLWLTRLYHPFSLSFSFVESPSSLHASSLLLPRRVVVVASFMHSSRWRRSSRPISRWKYLLRHSIGLCREFHFNPFKSNKSD